MSNGLTVIDHQPTEVSLVRSQAAMQFAEIKQFADEISRSGLFNLTPSQALALMLLSQSKGQPFIQGCIEYHVIMGKPSMKADVRTAKFQNLGGTIEWIEYTDETATAKFAHAKYQPKGITLTATRAKCHEKKIDQEYDKDKKEWRVKATWDRTPGAMLRATIERQAITMICPGIAAGVPDEDTIEATVIDVTPAEQSARGQLMDKLKARIEGPKNGSGVKDSHQPVADTAAEIKAHQNGGTTEKPQETAKSPCREWIDDMITETNKEIAAKDPGAKWIVAHQVASTIVNEAVKAGKTDEAVLLNAAGKRDTRAVGAEVNRLWATDETWVMSTAGAYLMSKIPTYSAADAAELAGAEA